MLMFLHLRKDAFNQKFLHHYERIAIILST